MSPGAPPADVSAAAGRQRVDKWLWHARVVKTRSLAAKLVAAGKVKRNDKALSAPADLVRLGDLLAMTVGERQLVYKVLGIGERRGPAPEAQLLYEDLSPPPAPRAPAANGRRDAGAGRPTKRDRRLTEKLFADHHDED